MENVYLLAEGRLRRITLALYTRAQAGWPFLTLICDEAFKQERLPQEERGLVAEALMDMVRWRRSVAAALGVDEADGAAILEGTLLLRGKIPPDAPGGVLTPEQRALIPAWPQKLAAVTDPVEHLALEASLPDWMARLLLSELGETRARSVALALNEPPPQTLRVNTLKANVVDALGMLPFPGRMTDRAPTGITMLERGNLFNMEAFQEGVVESQDEASQLVCQVVAPPPGSTVVDACAGAGGKTLGVGAMLNNKGRIFALDVHDGRLKELRSRARRAGLSNVQAMDITVDGPLPEALNGIADRVLVDAPCSGLGALRRNPEARWRLQEEDLPRLAQQQFAIAERALGCLKVGGRLIYATCSFARAECEEVVERLLAAHPELERVRVKEIVGKRMVEGLTDAEGWNLRTWPDVMQMDGFFTAVMRKKR
jgi:16S rRNA (cytosine967-C5)-methyltransferase